ncbi:class F sortase [Microbacterium sp. R86528]|uniref:class F sortase n=1 Tax=Microbacterium sp. R86528 TaxID=3093864 RepID=UPI0037CC20EB
MIFDIPRERPIAHRSWLAVSAMALALAVCLSACTAPASEAEQPVPEPTQTVTVAPTAAVDVPVTSSKPAAIAEVVAPVTVSIDQIGVNMPIVPVGVDASSQMELPEDPAVAGWYRFGPDADSDSGNMVLSAHVDAPQFPIGPLAGLRDVSKGESVVITDDSGGVTEYVFTSVTYYPKTKLPVDEIFAREGEPALVIITCGGPFDSSTGRYRDNVVAVAVPA